MIINTMPLQRSSHKGASIGCFQRQHVRVCAYGRVHGRTDVPPPYTTTGRRFVKAENYLIACLWRGKLLGNTRRAGGKYPARDRENRSNVLRNVVRYKSFAHLVNNAPVRKGLGNGS